MGGGGGGGKCNMRELAATGLIVGVMYDYFYRHDDVPSRLVLNFTTTVFKEQNLAKRAG